MQYWRQARWTSWRAPFRISPFRVAHLPATLPRFAMPPGADDPVMAARRSRRRRAFFAGLVATALLGGGMACAMHPAHPQPPAARSQVNSAP